MRVRAIGSEEQKPVLRHEVHQPTERQQHGIEVGVDVGVIEFDVADDGDVRQVFQELGGPVEEGAVVFVALDDEVSPPADAIARALCRN